MDFQTALEKRYREAFRQACPDQHVPSAKRLRPPRTFPIENAAMTSNWLINIAAARLLRMCDVDFAAKWHRHIFAGLMVLCCIVSTGCTSLFSPVNGVPAHRLPSQFLATPKNDLIPIDISRLRQQTPRQYFVDAGDVLGVYIEGVLGNPDEPPPVRLQEKGSDLPPSIGYPIPIREDGTLALPLVQPIMVRGLSLTQVQNVIYDEYVNKNKIIQEGKDRIIVTLMQERTYRVIVMRQDAAITGNTQAGSSAVGAALLGTRGHVVDLPAYKNDVLHALAETGGLPGVNSKNEIQILRSSLMDSKTRDEFVQKFYNAPPCDPCLCRPPLPPDPAILRIPLRLPPGVTPTIRPEDVILQDGDIVLIEGREREVFYTGGLLGGGEFPLPRDYDLDVLGALAIAGAGAAGGGNRGGGGGGGGGLGVGNIGGLPPGLLHILRKTPCNDQITITVDLNRAINSPRARPLIQPGDILILQYKPVEEALNFGIGSFFTFGIAQLFQGNNR